MTLQFTQQGLSVDTFDEIYQRLVTQIQLIYGNDVTIDPEDPDGQRLGILSQLELDLETYALQLYNQMDADLASGDWLNKLIKFAAIYRRPATRSQVDVVITTDRPLTLPAGYTVADDLEQLWITTTALQLPSGANDVTLVAANFGNYTAAPNTVDNPVSVVIGVVSVTNPLAALPGRNEETDEELRIRRNASVENPAYSTVGSLLAKLANLPNVTDVVVYENDKPTQDVPKDMEPNSVWVVIEGGIVTTIVETMVKQRTAGVNTKGTLSGIYNETVVRPDGSTFNIVHEMNFDRPVLTPLKIRLTATRTDTLSPIDIPLMKEKLVARKFRIGENVKASGLYAIAYQTGTNFVLSNLEISDDGGATWTDESVISAYDGKFTVVASDINITEVV